MESTLTLPNLTCIDHAYIDEQGHVRGRSFHASFYVTGTVDEYGEKVVVDFSKIKKYIKSIVDDHATGFDHKLWIGHSHINLLESGNLVSTPYVSLDVPKDAVRVFDDGDQLNLTAVEAAISRHVRQELWHRYSIRVTIVCKLNTVPMFMLQDGVYGMFSYAHGLRDSSAYGCQNLAHGHLSYLQLIPAAPSEKAGVPADCLVHDSAAASACGVICDDLTDTVFIYKDNILSSQPVAEGDYGTSIVVDYQSCDRGRMSGSFIDTNKQKLVVLETETTVEYLAEYINQKYGKLLRAVDVSHFIVSEGLSKGVMFEVTVPVPVQE